MTLPQIDATEIQPALADLHFRMLHEASGIADDVIRERGYRTLDGPTGYDELKRLGFSTTHAKQRPGLLLPLHTTDGTQPVTIYRPDSPSVDARRPAPQVPLPYRSTDAPGLSAPVSPRPGRPADSPLAHRRAEKS